MELLVISEHTEETLSLKEWEEKLLLVRDGTESQGHVCATLDILGLGSKCGTGVLCLLGICYRLHW